MSASSQPLAPSGGRALRLQRGPHHPARRLPGPLVYRRGPYGACRPFAPSSSPATTESGSALSIDLATLTARPYDLLVTGDTVGRVFGHTLALINRSAAVADNVRFYDLSAAPSATV